MVVTRRRGGASANLRPVEDVLADPLISAALPSAGPAWSLEFRRVGVSFGRREEVTGETEKAPHTGSGRTGLRNQIDARSPPFVPD